MYQRWVALMTRGATKYDANNWLKASGQAEYDRFLESCARHFETWFMWRRYGINIEDPEHPTTEPLTEDHAAAVFFNINGVEYVAERMASPLKPGDVVTFQSHYVLNPNPKCYCQQCSSERGNSPDDRYMS